MAKELTASELAYYQTAATVLPIFMIALALQLDSRRLLESFFGDGAFGRAVIPWIAFGSMVVMGGSEVLAVLALKDDRVSGSTPDWVAAALVIGALILLYGTLQLVLKAVRADPKSTEAP